MEIIFVKSVSQKGKARIHEFGNKWRVIRRGQRGLFIQSVDDEKGLSKRWLDLPTDSDLEIL